MNTECRKVEENLIDFVEKRVSESLQIAIEEHCESCPHCDRLVKRFALIWQEFTKRERLTPSASFWSDLYDKIHASEKPQLLWDKIFIGFKNSLRPAAIILVLFFGVFFGYHLGNVPEGFGEISEPKDIDQKISEEMFVDQYIQDFQDFPLGSVDDFYMRYEIQKQDEEP